MNDQNQNPESDELVIQLRDVTKTYSMGAIDVHALAGVSLNIRRGEFVSIMGASGSGKSTLMNILGCLDVPTTGEYLLDEERVEAMSPDRLANIRSRKIGFVFQTPNLLPRMNAIDNVLLPMMYGRWRNVRKNAEKALQQVGLADRMDHKPTEMSGGQQQRVGIARAFVKNPSILLADEPTGNLDSASTKEILQIIAQLNREQRIIIVLITHDPEVANQADRLVTLRDGRIISDERPARHKVTA